MESRAPLWDSDMFFQMNYDADGPEYFQSSETLSNAWFPNVTGVYSVANSIEDKLMRNDWPGMPTASFYDKWKSEASAADGEANVALAAKQPVYIGNPNLSDPLQDTLREIDQIAWNIISLGTYAADRTPAYDPPAVGSAGQNQGGFNDANYGQSNQGIVGSTSWPEDISFQQFLGNYSAANSPTCASTEAFNEWAQRGELSGKAILPYSAAPLINEIVAHLYLVNSSGKALLPGATLSNGYYVGLSFDFEAYTPVGMPPWLANNSVACQYIIVPTHVEFEMTDNGSAVAPPADTSVQIHDLYTGTLADLPTNVTSYMKVNYDPSHGSAIGMMGQSPYYCSLLNLGVDAPLIDLSPGKYQELPENTPDYGWVEKGTQIPGWPMGPSNNPPGDSKIQKFTGTQLTITNLKVRVASYLTNGSNDKMLMTTQLIPMWCNSDTTGTSGPNGYPMVAPTGQNDYVTFVSNGSPVITINAGELPTGQARVGLEVVDPRNGGNSNAWVLSKGTNPAPASPASITDFGDADSFGNKNTPPLDGNTNMGNDYRQQTAKF